jgi:3-methyladenine DNA glycosylase AlkD
MMVVASPQRPTSLTTARADAFVAAGLGDAALLGDALAELVGDPSALAAALAAGFERLADPEYQHGQERVAPGLGRVHGVRQPLLRAVVKSFRRATRDDRPTTLLFVADRLLGERELEARWFAFDLLARTLPSEPERSWQLLRRAARESADWITVDSLAHAYGDGIAAEPYRWAELDQLVYSPSRWERRLVGSTVATMTHGRRRARLGRATIDHGLPLLAQLIGDAEPDVQKALSWAYRSLAQVDPEATAAALAAETDRAVETDDGHRAWVIRDSLTKLDDITANVLRARLVAIRRRPTSPSTSEAAGMAARFGGLPDPINHPEPPLA